MNDNSIASLFDQYFSVIPANTEQLIKKVYNIRHQVYCEELGFEAERTNHLEFDEYDLRSSHCLLFHKPSQTYAGCVRLIMADPHDVESKFPFEITCGKQFSWNNETPTNYERHKYGEISRLAITAHFRRRRGEAEHPDGGSAAIDNASTDERRSFPSVALGLYLATTAIAIDKSLEGVFAIMEPRLARQLRRFGFLFEQVGDLIDHRGQRAPFLIRTQQVSNTLKAEYMELLANIQNQVHSNNQIAR